MHMDLFYKLVLAFALTVAGIGGAQAQSAAAIPARLDLHGGQVVVYKSDRPLERVAVGNGALIEVTTIDKRQLVVIAGAGVTGFTTMHVWYTDGGQRTIEVNVNGANQNNTLGFVRQMLGPDTAARITDVGGKIVITGELTAEEGQRVEAIKGVYPDVVNLSSADLVGMKPMVLMDVRIMEFKRDAMRELGIQWDSVIDGPSGGAIKDFNRAPFRILPKGSPFLDLDLPPYINPMETYLGIATSITSKINLMTQNGDAYELAAPQLSARSGGTATFLAGGEIPLATTSGFGATTVEFKEYGIKLDIQPFVNANNEISAVLATEVSKIDPAVTVLGYPGFLTRRTETEVNVKSGQTMVISGLVDIQGSKAFSGIPGLANIPVLGRLFRSDDFRAGRSDLVVFVTPRVIHPDDPANLEAIQKSDRMLEDFKTRIGTDIFD